MISDARGWPSPSDVSRAAPPRARPRRPWLGAPLARALVIALATTSALALPRLVDDYVLSAVLVPILALALAGIGQNITTGYAGQLSVGSAAFMCVGAFATYDVQLHVTGLPLLLAFGFGGMVAAVAGLFFGLPALRVKGFYVVVSTLAAQFFFVWLFTKVGWFSNYSASGVISAPRLRIAGIDLSSPAGHYWLSLLVVVPMTLAARHLARGRVGRSWMAVRDMEIAASVIGVRTGRAKLSAFAVGAFYCGVAGALWAFAYLGTVEPHGLDLDRSFQILFIVILGGLGSIGGPFIGAGFVILLPVALDRAGAALTGGDVDPGAVQNIQKILFGALVIGLLIKEPAGLVRLAEIARLRLQRRFTRSR